MNQVITHPFVTTVIIGIVWPLIQAALDKPTFKKSQRVAMVVIVGVLGALAIWLVGRYPLQWGQLTQWTVQILGFAWASYQALSAVKINGVSLIEWAGIVTPGGETLADYPRARV